MNSSVDMNPNPLLLRIERDFKGTVDGEGREAVLARSDRNRDHVDTSIASLGGSDRTAGVIHDGRDDREPIIEQEAERSVGRDILGHQEPPNGWWFIEIAASGQPDSGIVRHCGDGRVQIAGNANLLFRGRGFRVVVDGSTGKGSDGE